MPTLTIDILLIDMDEYRLQDGWGRGGKRGSHRVERFPRALVSCLRIASKQDYEVFIPSLLPAKFSARDYMLTTGLTARRGNSALRFLTTYGLLVRAKKGRKYIYERKTTSEKD